MAEETITLDGFEEQYRAAIGTEMDLNDERFVAEVTRDNIRNFAEAIGDNNPLWINEEYAAKSRFGIITAPPTFIYNVNHGTTPSLFPPGGPPVMNLGLLYVAAELEFHRTIYLGDEISVSGKAIDIVMKQSKSLGPTLFVTGDAYYRNQRQEPVGTIRTTQCRFIPPEKQTVHYDRYSKSEFEIKSPDLLAYERPRRGAEPRYWEDIQIGEEMTPVLEKGLLTMTEIFRFGILVSPIPRRIERRRPDLEIGFGRETRQKRSGLEDASDYGPQRVCWLGEFLTDWMGDDGTLKKYSCQVRHPSIMGDSNFVKGRVTSKRIDDGEYLVDCQIWVENQAGLITAPGQATIALPARG